MPRRGRPTHAERSTTPQTLGAMLHARLIIHKLIERIDAALYNHERNQAITPRGLDALVGQAIAALSRLRDEG